jgi:hypothetical protein
LPNRAEFNPTLTDARIQDALQDLLAQPLTSVVFDTIGVCSKAHAPEQWHNLCNAVFELHGVDEDAFTTRGATRVLFGFIAAMRPKLEGCNYVRDVIAWINTLLDF